MPQIQVTIAGRAYRMACGEGEEAHLTGLAELLDGKVSEMRAAFGEIGDMRLHVMAALTVADDLAETRRRIAALESEIAALRALAGAEAERSEAAERQIAAEIARAADAVERLARGFAPSARLAAEPD
ncbi:MAG: cell division protein ZapA [Methylobacteriaceae bacterium]|nr:cell division protein ZapA [Methylobacteriaceae bacterium]